MQSKNRRKALTAWGALVGLVALLTTAAFTDAIYLNFGTGTDDTGIGGGGDGTKSYNLQVGATNTDGTFKNDNTWQEADDPKGVPIKLAGAEALFPGSPAATVEIPVKNASKAMGSTLAIKLVNHDPSKTDVNYLNALRFTISMPATVSGSNPVLAQDKTFNELSSGLALNDMKAETVSKITVTVTLPSQGQPADDALNGKAAFVQAVLSGNSKYIP
ncbi:MAG: hypothetical protein LBR20_06930 [Propionibacteriaceae bacterium]|jgi:hypothetical protein|nr:hypothetical protein [Propionibacteriaceae bacterium]